MLADVVRPQDRRAALVGDDGGGDACRKGPGRRLGVAQDPAERALAREADEHRASEREEDVEAPHELEVLLDGLSEADPRIDANSRLGDARVHGDAQPLFQEAGHLRRDVLVGGVALHRPRLPLHVHQADISVGLGDDARQLGIPPQRGHVVDELGAEVERAPRDLRLRGVDRDGRAVQAFEHRHDAAELLVEPDAFRAGSGRLAADVDDHGALVEHPPSSRDGGDRLQVDTSV